MSEPINAIMLARLLTRRKLDFCVYHSGNGEYRLHVILSNSEFDINTDDPYEVYDLYHYVRENYPLEV